MKHCSRALTGLAHFRALAVLAIIVLSLVFLTGAGPDTVVYITNTGSRYHEDGCTSLRTSRVAVTLLEAYRAEYEACQVCRPPVLAALPENAVETAGELYRVNIASLRSSAAADISRMLRVEVSGHVDGDTVRVRIFNPPADLNLVETIRLIGVDTPETVHPNQEVGFFGKEASDFTRDNLFGKTVFLAFDWDLRDRYGRLLAYIYTEDGRCFNARLIREGYGHAYLRFSFQFMDEFRNLEQEARREGRGLWAPR